MDARDLSYFLAVIEHGGISKAARALRVSQPTLSQCIKQLERELHVELLVRTSRGVQPTAAGRSLVEPARQVLRGLRIAQESVGEVVGLRGGSLDVVAVPSLAIHPLSTLVGTFRRRFPDVRIRVVDPDDVEDAAALVRSGDCEIGLVEDISPRDELVGYDLARQDVVLVLPPGSPIGSRAVTWQELAGYEFVTSPLGRSASRARLEQIFAATGAELRICVESDHRTAVAEFVLAGAGAALLRRPIAESMRTRGARICDLHPAVSHQVTLIHRRDVLGPAGRAFVDLARGPAGAAAYLPSRDSEESA